MNEPKKQHYVPQTYLRNFSFKSNNMDKICVFSKRTSKQYVANVSDTSAKRHFYTLEGSNDKYIVEKFFAKEIEPLLKNIIDKIISLSECKLINDGATILTFQDKLDLATCVIYQLIRSTNFRAYTYEKYDEMLPKIRQITSDKFGQDNVDWFLFDSIMPNNEKIKKDVSINALLSKQLIKKMVTEICCKNFLLIKIKKGEFITSDNPVMLVNSITSDVTPFTNKIANNSTIIYYPLTPKILLGIFSNSGVFKSTKEHDCTIKYLSEDFNFVNRLNKKQLEHCQEYIYSPNNNFFDKL